MLISVVRSKIQWLFLFLTYFVISISSANSSIVNEESLHLFDKSRDRSVPVELYANKNIKKGINSHPLVIVSHGYTIENTEYAFIANKLAAKGYIVISIQHDLPSDPPLARTGALYEQRKPVWEQGVNNIIFAINEIKTIYPNLNTKKLILIGHSNGGDISMLFATEYPSFVAKIISLDSLRMPLPRSNDFSTLVFRANDTKADDGVMPNYQEQQNFNIEVIDLVDAKHIDLCDRGPENIKVKINQDIDDFVNKPSPSG